MAIKNKDFYINMKNPPEWDPNLSYFEQRVDVLEFFEEEWEKITNGYEIDGVFIHPFLYWHVNYFKTNLPQPDKTEPLMCPYFDDNIWYFMENYKEAGKSNNKGVCMFGTRGFGKSVVEASLALWTSTVKENGSMTVAGGAADDLDAVNKLIQLAHHNLHPAFKVTNINTDWEKSVVFGLLETTHKYQYSWISIKNLEKGKDTASEKGAGGTPSGAIVDEIGKFDVIKYIESAKPSWITPYGAKLIPLLSGTGGNKELSTAAKKILNSPASYFMIDMNWDRLNNMVPESARTWKSSMGKPFATFVPGQMSYRLECEKIVTNLADFLGVESETLSKITFRKTDWEKATELLKKNIENQKEASGKLKERMYYPQCTEDCFLTDSANPFDVNLATEVLAKVNETITYRKMEFKVSDSGKYDFQLSNKKLAERMYGNVDTDAPYMVFGEIPTEKPGLYTYISGMDDYKSTRASESTSLGVLYILKRRSVDLDCPIEQIALSYAARPHASHSNLHYNILKASNVYGAMCNLESSDQFYKNYLENNGLDYNDYLCPPMSPGNQAISYAAKNVNSLFGTYPTGANIDHMLNLVIAYTQEDVEIGFDEHGSLITKKGMEFIQDPYLLEEIINYDGSNSDRIFAFGWALVYARELDKKNIRPKDNKPKQPIKKKSVGFKNFSMGGFKNFGLR